MSTALRAAFASRRVLLTGHTGFKGSWLATWLHALGAEVTGYALDPPTRPSHFEACGTAARLHDERGDVRDFERLAALVERVRPEYVFHLAAQALVRQGLRAPRETFEVNVMGTVNVLEAARRAGSVRALVVVTSDKCYRNLETGRPFREDDALGGHEPYGGSKAAAELAVEVWQSQRFQTAAGTLRPLAVATARAGNVIGGGDWAADRLVPDLLRARAARQPLRLRRPHARRPWQHVLEPLAGYLWLAARLANEPVRCARAWNFGPGSGETCRVEELARRLLELWPAEGVTLVPSGTSSEAEAGELRLDVARARDELGWHGVWSLAQALAATVTWHQALEAAPTPGRLWALTCAQIEEYTAAAAQTGLPWAAPA